ncbi:hypothetical protein H0E87_021462 [Populus deltoides]|uniref:Uncharacterized protein n=1 Tax=Populus deltoides TaxID=3696 RepID=A0A8T2XGT2_POPDE|nr:hypothetical protein H0E87_021462 [Populus deltoides]
MNSKVKLYRENVKAPSCEHSKSSEVRKSAESSRKLFNVPVRNPSLSKYVNLDTLAQELLVSQESSTADCRSTGLVNSIREAKQKFEERFSGKKKTRRYDQ